MIYIMNLTCLDILKNSNLDIDFVDNFDNHFKNIDDNLDSLTKSFKKCSINRNIIVNYIKYNNNIIKYNKFIDDNIVYIDIMPFINIIDNHTYKYYIINMINKYYLSSNVSMTNDLYICHNEFKRMLFTIPNSHYYYNYFKYYIDYFKFLYNTLDTIFSH